MTTTVVTRVTGPTFALSVAATQHAAVGVPATQNDGNNYAEFTNIGATDICVVLAPFAATPATPVLVFPVDGTPTVPNSFILPHAMNDPIVKVVPANGFCVSAIGSGAGPSIFYVTPVSVM